MDLVDNNKTNKNKGAQEHAIFVEGANTCIATSKKI
jgi:hypothetical protein